MKERIYNLYMHVNKINDKKYIGITKFSSLNKRWCNGNGYKNNPYFNKAIKKYGWDNFKHELIFCNLTKEEAEALEIQSIKYFKTTNRKFGYNISNGGEVKGKHSEESKIKMSKTKKRNAKPISEEQRIKLRERSSGKNNPMYGKNFSEEHRRKISKGLKEYYKNNKGTFFGRNHTENNKKILSKKKQKKFICIETGKIYDSPLYACKELNISYSYLCRRCKNGKPCKGYHFKYLEKDYKG